MIKGLAITPPVIGRISIGHLVQKGEKWVPEKDDSFTLTTQVQGRNGWVLHPLHQHRKTDRLFTLIPDLSVREMNSLVHAESSCFNFSMTGSTAGNTPCQSSTACAA